jgi:hypothetical protein
MVFGPFAAQVLKQNWPYDLAAALDAPMYDAYRPELFWHAFRTPAYDVSKGTGIYVLRKK